MYKDWRNRVRGWVILDGEGNVIEKEKTHKLSQMNMELMTGQSI